mmetsp:Transcript_10452/g.31947  ORF Transcript_10452/g.31947 Transcript_10452/m.31947 type:complete len:187 (-) Transcript_10452:594-1154(-)
MDAEIQHASFQRLKNLHLMEEQSTGANVVERMYGRGMRRLLFDWYNQVRMCLNLSFKCVELAITYFSRFLEKTPVAREHVHSIAMVCLYLAIKFCETTPVRLEELYRCISEDENHIEQRLFRRMEFMVLDILEWRLNAATVSEFVLLYIAFLDVDEDTTKELLKYAEIAVSRKYCNSHAEQHETSL